MKNRTTGRAIPSFNPLSTLSAWRIRTGTFGLLTTACPRAAVGGSENRRGYRGFPETQRVEQGRRQCAGADRQRQPDPQQAQREIVVSPQNLEINPRRIGGKGR